MADISISEIQKMFASDIARCIEEARKRVEISLKEKENTVDYVFKKLFKEKEVKSKHLYEQGYIIL
jgi:hypothetical protein